MLHRSITDGDLNTLRKDDELGPMRARSDLVDILSHDPENTEALITLIQSELTDLKDGDSVSRIKNAISQVASQSNIDSQTTNNVLYWLTKTNPDVRQMILVQTIEELLRLESSKETTLKALYHVSSKDNVEMVLEWVNRKILTLNQAVYVLLYPDSSSTLL